MKSVQGRRGYDSDIMTGFCMTNDGDHTRIQTLTSIMVSRIMYVAQHVSDSAVQYMFGMPKSSPLAVVHPRRLPSGMMMFLELPANGMPLLKVEFDRVVSICAWTVGWSPATRYIFKTVCGKNVFVVAREPEFEVTDVSVDDMRCRPSVQYMADKGRVCDQTASLSFQYDRPLPWRPAFDDKMTQFKTPEEWVARHKR